MSCKLDVNKAILDHALKLVADGRYTFTRTAVDTIIVNNKADNSNTRAKSASQARAIAKQVILRVHQAFKGHVRGRLEQLTPYDPVTIKFTVTDSYINHVYNNLPSSEKRDNGMTLYSPSKERDHINTNTDENTFDFFSMSTSSSLGSFAKLIAFKQSQLSVYRDRLNRVLAEKKKRDLTQQDIKDLNKQERELKELIEGNFEKGVIGLVGEITALKQNQDINAVGFYVEKDLARLETLVKSSDVLDLEEAQRMIDFYTLAGTFSNKISNPFFEPNEIFAEVNGELTDTIILPPKIVDEFVDWKKRAETHQNTLNKRFRDITTMVVNQTRNTSGRLSFDDIVESNKGLRDTDWISMWVMDITQGIFSNNGLIPQVMFSYLSDSFEKKLSWAREIEERIDKINPQVQQELIKLGYTLRGGGIVGISGANYNLFKEITRDGNETGGLIQKFSREFFDSLSAANNAFRQKFNAARVQTDYNKRTAAYNAAFDNIKRWRRTHTKIVEFGKLPEFGGTDTTYQAELKRLLGEKTYKAQVEKQKSLLTKYEADRESNIEALLIEENVPDYNSLSQKAKSHISFWEINHDPMQGIKDYSSLSGLQFGGKKVHNFMDYNVFIPREFVPNVSLASDQDTIVFTNTARQTGYYTSEFSTIENNPILSDFYDILKEVTDTIREVMPYELQSKLNTNTLPALQKGIAETLADNNISTLNAIFDSAKNLSERIRLGLGVVEQSQISYAVTDPITGKRNYKVNAQFLQSNGEAIIERTKIEQAKFIAAYNKTSLSKINRFTAIPLVDFSEGALHLLADYIHMDLPASLSVQDKIAKLKTRVGDTVQIGKYIRDYSMHTVVQSQSFDLAKTTKFFSNIAMQYAARQEALPILNVLKKHYEEIQKPLTTNVSESMVDAGSKEILKAGLRTNAIKQMDDWFERVVLGNYGTKHVGLHGSTKMSKNAQKINTRLNDIEVELSQTNDPVIRAGLIKERERLILKRAVPSVYGRTIYSEEDKKKIVEIETAIASGKLSKEESDALAKIRANLGKTRSATAVFDSFMAWIRTLRIGYNISSAVTNLMEGTSSNMILAATGDYFNPKEIYFGYHVAKLSFLKNVTFGAAELPLARKSRKLMDKFRVLMDSKNELQKSTVRTYASKFSWLSPHELNQRVEYINQSPVMIAMLRSMEITGSKGQKSSVWDAYDTNGKLKAEFRTPENIKDWEDLQGDNYLGFKQKLHKGIVLAHGNYDELRGMMAKSNTAGKALMMFKTWLPMQLYNRFATEQYDVQTGVNYKGRYWSYTKGTASLHLGTVGGVAFGPIGFVLGGAAGYAIGNFFGKESDLSFLQETVVATKALAKKIIGMPVNLIAGKQLIDDSGKEFDSWARLGTDNEVTEQDVKNLKANMADIALQLTWFSLMLTIKGMLWDDEDEPDSWSRLVHNSVVNKLNNLSSQAAMYVNPVDSYKNTLGSNAVAGYLEQLGKELVAIQKYLDGDDIISSGPTAGESRLFNQTTKTFLPGLGITSQSERVFEESPYHRYFESELKVDKRQNQGERARLRNKYEDQGLSDKEIRKLLREQAPTQSELKKMGLTRDEFEAIQEEREEQEEN